MLDLYMDLDDTLIQTQNLFEKYKRSCTNFILLASKREDLKVGNVLTFFNERERANIEIYGFHTDRFSISWKETYAHFIPEGKEGETVGRLANMVFQSVSPLKDGAIETLETLKAKGYSIHLITVGMEDAQMKRLQDVGISHYFKAIDVVPYKDKHTYEQIVKDKKNSVMIGNSTRSDINPSIELGMAAIKVEAPNWFHDDMPLLEGGEVYHGTLWEVPELVATIEMTRASNATKGKKKRKVRTI